MKQSRYDRGVFRKRSRIYTSSLRASIYPKVDAGAQVLNPGDYPTVEGPAITINGVSTYTTINGVSLFSSVNGVI